jgi:hypothetical protein
MQKLENKEFTILDGAGISKATLKEPLLSGLEASIIAKSEYLNIPALASFFSITEDEVKNALTKK